MSAVEFEAWPKIARLNRNIVISEKLDGTNAAVVIVPVESLDRITYESGDVDFFGSDHRNLVVSVEYEEVWYAVFAQSRTRFITPQQDNYGFAGWVQRNAEALVKTLGPGRHFGEWWGAGIQRKYGLTGTDKRFSLFNTNRWVNAYGDRERNYAIEEVPGLHVVPVLYDGPFDQDTINATIDELRASGSVAAPGFSRPEGIVVWHDAARQSFKVTLEGDEAPKGAAGHALDEERKAA